LLSVVCFAIRNPEDTSHKMGLWGLQDLRDVLLVVETPLLLDLLSAMSWLTSLRLPDGFYGRLQLPS